MLGLLLSGTEEETFRGKKKKKVKMRKGVRKKLSLEESFINLGLFTLK